MRMYDLIEKKRNGGELSEAEIRWMVRGFTKGEIPDYQMAAFLMAVYFKGMTDRETGILTDAVARSGDMVDLSGISGKKVDKHSTGGVGDKTTLIVAPMAAAAGVKVAKMSGRGLGHTGGTVDKLESIPGFQTVLSRERFFEVVNETGLSLIGQSGNLAPADKKLYALRDVTATVESIPLIASSIMGKKLAAGSDCILLDVKVGSGAFMKTEEDAEELAEKMVAIGRQAGKPTVALITDMDLPLGHCIGNTLEVQEAIATLNGEGPADLTELSVELAANMIYLAGLGTLSECRKKAEETIRNKSAAGRFAAMVEAQGGDPEVIRDPKKLKRAKIQYELKAERSGYLSHMDTEGIGLASGILGAGRETLESTIDYTAGIELLKKTGDYVKEQEPLAVFHTSDQKRISAAEERFLAALKFSEKPVPAKKLILKRIE
jgi:pyrimidine-nucleoside phosphorylase